MLWQIVAVYIISSRRAHCNAPFSKGAKPKVLHPQSLGTYAVIAYLFTFQPFSTV